jgi:hypothetical protein
MCDNPIHDHDNEDDNLLSVIQNEVNEPEEIASIAIQLFCAISSTLVQAEMPNPAIYKAFEPMKLLAEKLGSQELNDIVITCEMEHHDSILKAISKMKHPAGKRKKWGN